MVYLLVPELDLILPLPGCPKDLLAIPSLYYRCWNCGVGNGAVALDRGHRHRPFTVPALVLEEGVQDKQRLIGNFFSSVYS